MFATPRRLNADSAVRFTPAVKYGGRENQPSRRTTSCMSSHPCRAHHKLKWARTEQSDIVLLYKQVPRSESIKATSTQNRTVHTNSARSTLFDRGWQQPLNHHKAQPARRVKDAAGTAKPLVLDTARWLGYFLCLSACHSFRAHILSPFSINAKIAARSLRNRNETRRFLPYPALSPAYQILPANYRVLFRSDLWPCAPDPARRLCATAPSSRLLHHRRSNPQTTGSHSPQCYQDLHR